MNRLLVPILVIGSAAVALYYFSAAPNLEPDVVPQAPLQTSLAPPHRPAPAIKEAPLPVLAKTEKHVIWAPAQQIPAILPHHNPAIPDQVLLEFEMREIKALTAGDVFRIAVPQLEREFNVEITRVEMTPRGNMTLHGSGDGYPFVMTPGNTTMFATFGTDEGSFNVRGNSTHAWIVASRTLRTFLNTDEPDYRVPPRERKA